MLAPNPSTHKWASRLVQHVGGNQAGYQGVGNAAPYIRPLCFVPLFHSHLPACAEQEKRRRQAAEQERINEEERLRQEAAEAERQRLEAEEEARLKRQVEEEEEQLRREAEEEEERLRKEAEEEEERLRQEQLEMEELQRREEEELRQLERREAEARPASSFVLQLSFFYKPSHVQLQRHNNRRRSAVGELRRRRSHLAFRACHS